ncbi:MAG: cobyrinate a,c-diamide synthase [Candidatus Omnitrophica bacterium]|nr:cobyrinate a,c-diamide synthase [Candidatus Omnitrophota bacterium]
MNYPRVILAGTNSRVGKTTLTMGLIAALRKRGLRVQPFKAGPDYIDPSYHTLASGTECRNLDTWMLSKDAVLELFERRAALADISVVEGAMGLYDGIKDREEGSSAHLAKILKSPVILIVDASSMSRSAAAVVLGYKEFDKGLNLRGVILNNIGSPSHYGGAKKNIERKTGLPVLGFLPKDKNLNLSERYLGLIPAREKAPPDNITKRLPGLMENNIDIEEIIRMGREAPGLPGHRKRIFDTEKIRGRAAIAIARDAAFSFYYRDNLDILSHYGADLIEFSPISDNRLPQGADGLYIGGGFPELFAPRLSGNDELKNDILRKAKAGMPIYAECGGLMYLVKELVDFRKRRFPMVGIFNASVKMADGLRALGYVDIEVLKENALSDKGARTRAHVFHWSHLVKASRRETFAYRVRKDKENVFLDGFVKWNVLASYSHLHFGSNPVFAKNFIRRCYEHKNKK